VTFLHPLAAGNTTNDDINIFANATTTSRLAKCTIILTVAWIASTVATTATTTTTSSFVDAATVGWHADASQWHSTPMMTASSAASASMILPTPMSSSSSMTAVVPSLDTFCVQTTLLESNLAQFAQQGLMHMPHNAVDAWNILVSNSSSMHQQQQEQLLQQQQALFQPPTPTAFMFGNLDQEQKLALVQEHVGDLLPGKCVVMFLSHLLHALNSTGFTYNFNSNIAVPVPLTTIGGSSASANPPQQAVPIMWCCALMYYHLILFGMGSLLPPCPPN